jgi:hypothetical protein
LEDRGPACVLMALIDDATSKVVGARFEPTESARGYFELMRQVCAKVGVPQSLYSDRHSIFWATNGETVEDQLGGRRSTTQFGRAMEELGVRLIPAHSPQAKGRVERLWGTLQDRLVSELRLANVTTIEQANAYLAGFLARFNRKFAVEAQVPGSGYRPRLKGTDLDRVLCFKHQRVVGRDNCVRLGALLFQILPGPKRVGYAKAKVEIRESLDARYSIHYQGEDLRSKLIPPSTYLKPSFKPRGASDGAKAASPKETLVAPKESRTAVKPAPDHPWRAPVVTH